MVKGAAGVQPIPSCILNTHIAVYRIQNLGSRPQYLIRLLNYARFREIMSINKMLITPTILKTIYKVSKADVRVQIQQEYLPD